MWNKIKNNLANIITSVRFFVAIAILILYFTKAQYWLWRCLALFVLGSLTDVADGFVARKCNCVSSFGKLLDPVCDKSMLLAMMLVLTLGGYIYMWVFIALAAKELVMVLGAIFFFNKKIVVMSNWYGKLSTFMFTVAIIMSVFGWRPYCDWILTAAVIWTLITMVQYGVLYFRQLKDA